jgi:glucokinase-like ROK family protein
MKTSVNKKTKVNSNEVGGVAIKNKQLRKSALRLLDQNGSVTITEFAKELSISVPKATDLVNMMVSEGVLRDEGKQDSTGGRRANAFGLMADAGYFLGVDIKLHHVNFGLMDLKKGIISVTEKVNYHLSNTEDSLAELTGLVQDFINKHESISKKLIGIGLNIPGRINPRTGYNYNHFNFKEEPLSEYLTDKLGIPTVIENDSKAMVLGEFSNADAGNEKNAILINLDYGIGMGILIDGKIYHGKSGFSGELGHIPVFDNEIICHCGKKGCLETEASGIALLRKFKQKIQSGSTSLAYDGTKAIEEITLNNIIEAAKNEDTLCIEILEELGEKLGKAIAIVINIFNPETVILGGTLSETGEYLRFSAKSTLNRLSHSIVNNDTHLKVSQLGEKAGVIGACLNSRAKYLFDQ